MEREAEKRKFNFNRSSYNRSNPGESEVKSNLSESPHQDMLSPLKPVGGTFTANAKERGGPPTDQQYGPFFQQANGRRSSEYDDLLGCLFVNRRHPAYDRRQRADKRVEVVQNKFKDIHLMNKRMISESNIEEAYQKRNSSVN